MDARPFCYRRQRQTTRHAQSDNGEAADGVALKNEPNCLYFVLFRCLFAYLVYRCASYSVESTCHASDAKSQATFEGIVIEATVEVFGLIAVISYLNLCPRRCLCLLFQHCLNYWVIFMLLLWWRHTAFLHSLLFTYVYRSQVVLKFVANATVTTGLCYFFLAFYLCFIQSLAFEYWISK